MLVWVNGAFGSGKTTVTHELHRVIPGSFVYDPENAGYFIRKNIPPGMAKDDFQDHPMWREFNYSMLRTIGKEFEGIVLVPMTLVDPDYFDEIVGRLREDGIKVRHFALLASKQTLLHRLRRRGDREKSWPAKQIDRCIESLEHDRFGFHIRTDDLSVEQILAIVSRETGIPLLPDHRSSTRKSFDRLVVKWKHIRF